MKTRMPLKPRLDLGVLVCGVVVYSRGSWFRLDLSSSASRAGYDRVPGSRLFSATENTMALCGGEIKPDDVMDLLDETSVVRQLESLDQMRLQTVRVPNPLHARVTDAGRLGQGAGAPVRCGGWLVMQGHVNHLLNHRCRKGRLASTKRLASTRQAFAPYRVFASGPPSACICRPPRGSPSCRL